MVGEDSQEDIDSEIQLYDMGLSQNIVLKGCCKVLQGIFTKEVVVCISSKE